MGLLFITEPRILVYLEVTHQPMHFIN